MGAAALTLDGKMVQFEVHEQKANPVPVKESLAEMSVTRRDGFAKTPESYREFSISSLQPRWQQGKECFLTRRISDHGQVWVQGIWLDWGKLSAYLLESVADILPEATLSPADGREESYLTLAGIPAMLNPGNLASMPANSLRTVLEFHGDGVVLRASGPVRGHWRLHDRPHPPERTPRRIRFRRDA